jgi:hypothetical protein
LIYQVGQAQGTNSSAVGQQIAVMERGTVNSHAMTIVGYDDTVWVDLNGNGMVDTGEMGAFKVANSWGTSFANSGFIWVSYDALKDVSVVPGGPSSATRRPLIQQSTGFLLTVPASYTPRLVAEITLQTVTRNQIEIYFGSSDSFHNAPQVLLYPGALFASGGPHAFDGGSSPVSGTFYFDMTDLMVAHPEYHKYYVKLMDLVSGSPTVMTNLRLLKIDQKASLPYNGKLPQTVDEQTLTAVFADQSGIIEPPQRCPSVSRAWTHNLQIVCSATLPVSNNHDTVTVTDSTPPYTGQAQFTCNNGSWSAPENAKCQ